MEIVDVCWGIIGGHLDLSDLINLSKVCKAANKGSHFADALPLTFQLAEEETKTHKYIANRHEYFDWFRHVQKVCWFSDTIDKETDPLFYWNVRKEMVNFLTSLKSLNTLHLEGFYDNGYFEELNETINDPKVQKISNIHIPFVICVPELQPFFEKI